jgi:hypothetical protein
VRHGEGVVVAAARGDAPAGEKILKRRAHEHQAAFVLRKIDERAPSGPAAADHAGERGRGAEQRGDVVDVGTVEQHRRTVRNAGQLAHAGERRELRAEARLVRARPGLSLYCRSTASPAAD